MLRLVRDMAGPDGSRARGEFWLLLNLVLAQRLRMQARRHGGIGNDRIQDIASEKVLDLVGKLDCGHWQPLIWSEGELVSFLSTIARNAVVDELRHARRAELDRAWVNRMLPHGRLDHCDSDQGIDRNEFVSHLVACAGELKPRDRAIWLLRVLHEMPSKAIADHPEVLLKPEHVDVILERCRNQIRKSMRARGFHIERLPPGTFAELWKTFRARTVPSGSHP